MSFLTNLLSSTVKTVLVPVAITKDVLNVVQNKEPDSTKKLIESAIEDLEESIDDLSDGELI